MKKIQVISYDRRTEIRISKDIEIGLTDIQDYAKERFVRSNVTVSESLGLFIYKINQRLIKVDAQKLAIRLHKIAGLDYEFTKTQKQTPEPKKTISDPNIITGYKGNLIFEFDYQYK